MSRLTVVCFLAWLAVCAAQSSTGDVVAPSSTAADVASSTGSVDAPSSSGAAVASSSAIAPTGPASSSGAAAGSSSGAAAGSPSGAAVTPSASGAASSTAPLVSTAVAVTSTAVVTAPITSVVGFDVLNVTAANVNTFLTNCNSLVTAVKNELTNNNITWGATSITNTSVTLPSGNTTTAGYSFKVLITITTPTAVLAKAAASAIKASVNAKTSYNVTVNSFYCDSASSGFSVACPTSGFLPIYPAASSSTAAAAGVTSSTAVPVVPTSTAPVAVPTTVTLAFGITFQDAGTLANATSLMSMLNLLLPSLVPHCTIIKTAQQVITGLVVDVSFTIQCPNDTVAQTAATYFKVAFTTQASPSLAGVNATVTSWYCCSQTSTFSAACPASYSELAACPSLEASSTGSNGGGGSGGGDDKKLSTEAIIGLAVGIGGGGFIIILIIIICCCCCKGKGSGGGHGTEMMGSSA